VSLLVGSGLGRATRTRADYRRRDRFPTGRPFHGSFVETLATSCAEPLGIAAASPQRFISG
jgi:hypothetical protein